MSLISIGVVKVLGCGWAKTGTTTLGEALRLLGFQHQSQDLVLADHLPDTKAIVNAAVAESFEDWPWLLLYREFDQAFPDCRFILTVREPTQWLRSYRKHIGSQGVATPAMNALRSKLYGLPFPEVSDAQLIDRYERHNREVRAYFADRPAKLLEVDWSQGAGWAELGSFLDRPIPDVPFPHANKAEDRARPSLLKRASRRLSRMLGRSAAAATT